MISLSRSKSALQFLVPRVARLGYTALYLPFKLSAARIRRAAPASEPIEGERAWAGMETHSL